MKNEYLLIDKSILPDYFEMVLKVDDILQKNKKSVQLACDEVGISRSTYYKYKDKIIRPGKSFGKKPTITLLIKDEAGSLSKVLELLATISCNIERIYQDTPDKDFVNVTITLDISKSNIEIMDILNKLRDLDNIEHADLLRME